MTKRKRSTFRDRLIAIAGGVTQSDHAAALTRTYKEAYEDGGEDEPQTSTIKKYGYRRSTNKSVREFGGLDYQVVQDTAWRLWLMSPIAKRALQIKRDYILGRGVTIQAADEELQPVLDAFWKDNKLAARLKQYVTQLFLLGEQLFPVFVRDADGRVRLGYIDPIEIEEVITHPDNVLERWAVVVKAQAPEIKTWQVTRPQVTVYRVVRLDDEVVVKDEVVDLDTGYGKVMQANHPGMLITAEQANLEPWEVTMLGYYKLKEYTGSCFYFCRNALSNQPRGYTDLLQVADWIDQAEGVLFDLADREALAGYFFADVTIQGDPEAVKTRAAEIKRAPPKKGSVVVHNDKETWNLNAPDLKQAGSIETGKELITFILGGQGLPNHWYGRGDETNRATAQAQGDPTWRTMEHDQDQVRDMTLEMLCFARDQAEIAGTWKPKDGEDEDGTPRIYDEAEREEHRGIDLVMPEMTTKDLAQLSMALSGLATALMVAGDQGWMTQEHATEVWAKLMLELDIEIDPAKEAEDVNGAEEEGELEQGEELNTWLVQHGQLVPGEEVPALVVD